MAKTTSAGKPVMVRWLTTRWREAALLALVVALGLEFGINVFLGRTVWHRIGDLEEKVQQLYHERELEQLRTRQELEELQHKTDVNKQELKEVEKDIKQTVKK